ncbi:TraR/DksA family transcriptional regulator [Candidatus Caldatribacterium sp.]|uniref:TraR/DksA family transcriptional regulator n=1 Tax=Candidatus Caldatribacterium sp. TaxID=2282143 RepID=UPI0029912418|nr:TraR/DksA C4-type zinc finger protein [Candidatus Caldatribacterium sp.]MDW8081186.1 TraR/DksA C4-type zinc finger protein [Candidatus Calescibacterium sp.]
MNETEKRALQEELLKLREKITQALTRKIGEVPQEVLDEIDLGNTTLSMELEVSSRKQLAETLEMVEKALRRIAAGTYDICEICRRKIPLERLRAIPYTSLCVECQERQERAKK